MEFWMDRSTDHIRGVLLLHTNKTGIMRGVVGRAGLGMVEVELGVHDINLVRGSRGVKHKRQLCC